MKQSQRSNITITVHWIRMQEEGTNKYKKNRAKLGEGHGYCRKSLGDMTNLYECLKEQIRERTSCY